MPSSLFSLRSINLRATSRVYSNNLYSWNYLPNTLFSLAKRAETPAKTTHLLRPLKRHITPFHTDGGTT